MKPGFDNLADRLQMVERMAELELEDEQRYAFAVESDQIEGIEDEGASRAHEAALREFLQHSSLSVGLLERFVLVVAPKARLRDRRGRDVSIRDRRTKALIYRPPPGGEEIVRQLDAILDAIDAGRITPAEAHAAYESLHPFTDGNGRSGRALWAWHMRKVGKEPFGLPFLHRWYYQSLEMSRLRPEGA